MPLFLKAWCQSVMSRRYWLSWKVILLNFLFSLGASTAAQTAPIFKIALVESGVYRVTYEDLVAAGFSQTLIAASSLALSNEGAPVPLWVEDGGDGRFGPGVWFVFVGRSLT
ncbi:MAG: hypothetical protein AB7P69_16715, partial [Candidatus Binatia bacterium]